MIVTLEEVKTVVGIALDDASQDPYLTRLIKAKTAWVEGYTQRRFDTPILHSQIEPGPGEPEIYLDWHVDDTLYEPPLDPSPTTSVYVQRRPCSERFRPWEVLIEGEDWQRVGDVIYFLRAWQVWPREDEFKIDYLGGYGIAPEDIRDAIIDLVQAQYVTDGSIASDASSGTAGVTSEKIGDFSYSLGSSSSSSSSSKTTSAGGVVDTTMQTLNRYKRRFA